MEIAKYFMLGYLVLVSMSEVEGEKKLTQDFRLYYGVERVRFRGITCPHVPKPAGCKYSHDDRVVKCGQYRPKQRTAAEMAALEMTQSYGAEEEISSDSTDGTSVTRLDTPDH